MIVCPVCEHTQAQGPECEVCGKLLAATPAAPAPAPAALEGLERTAQGGAEVGGVAPMAELEATRHAPAAMAVEDLVPDLEATGAAPVDVAVAATPDVERTAHAALPEDDGLALPALPVCRYCRTPATADERICSRCGMRLPVLAAAPQAPAGAGGPEGHRCSCGLLLAPGTARCPGCGARAG